MPEPASSGGFNRYRYTRNNPLRYTDPSGHCVEPVSGAACLVAFTVIAIEATLLMATLVAVNSEPFQQTTQAAGEALGQGIRDLFEQVEGLTDSGGYGNSAGSQGPTYEGVPLSEPGDLSLPNVPPQVGPTTPPGFALEEPGAFGDGVLTSSGGRIPLAGGATDLPAGVQWGNAHDIKHPSWNPPDVPSKLDDARQNLAAGYDPNHPIGVVIESDGTMTAMNGNHRLHVAREEMGYDEVPIRVLQDKRN